MNHPQHRYLKHKIDFKICFDTQKEWEIASDLNDKLPVKIKNFRG